MDRIDEFLKSLLNKTKEERDLLRGKKHVCPSEETSACYLDNLLKDTEKEDFEEHLAECGDCLQQIILLYDIKKEVEQSGYMEVPTEATEQAKNLVQGEVGDLGSIIPEEPVPAGSLAPESSEKSLSSIISEFISNTIMARRGYRFVSYGSIALIVMLSVGVYSVIPTLPPEQPTLPLPNDYGIITRGGAPTQIADLTEQVEDEVSLGLSMRIISHGKDTDGSVSEVTIEEGSILRSKDKFKVQFETKKDAYVYIIIHDSLNKANLLFPDPRITLSNNVKANSSHTVPTSEHWFWLDENVGIETVYVLASETPLDNIKAMLLAMEDVEEPKQQIMEFVKDKAAELRAISFRHIDNRAEITIIKNTEKKVVNREEPGEERLRDMIVRGESVAKNILSSSMPNTVSESRIDTVLNNIKKNLILEESRGVGGISVYKKSAAAVVIVITNEGIIGSASMLDKEGNLLTNWHVVQGHDSVYVIFKPKKGIELKNEELVYVAKVIKVDQVTDLALLKIEDPPHNFSTLKLGNIEDVDVAQDVHAIGHPGGNVWTYTTGTISQIRPNYEIPHDIMTFKSNVIQTQTPINPGSSGGPLLNNNAEIVGINTFYIKGDGLNFAVSVDVIKEFLERRNSRFAGRPSTTSQIAPVSKEPSYYRYDTNGDGIDDLIGGDTDGNGLVDMYIVDLNQDGRIDHVKLDQDENGRIETVVYDTNKDGKFDTWAYDTNEDGYMDQWRGK